MRYLPYKSGCDESWPGAFDIPKMFLKNIRAILIRSTTSKLHGMKWASMWRGDRCNMPKITFVIAFSWCYRCLSEKSHFPMWSQFSLVWINSIAHHLQSFSRYKSWEGSDIISPSRSFSYSPHKSHLEKGQQHRLPEILIEIEWSILKPHASKDEVEPKSNRISTRSVSELPKICLRIKVKIAPI